MKIKPNYNSVTFRKTAYARNRKPVKWNNIEFESVEKLRGHLKLEYASLVTTAIKNKKELCGHIPERIE